MSLNAYRIQTRRLVQNPGEPVFLFDAADMDNWINTARGQIAGEGEAVRFLGSLITTPGVNSYLFSQISTGTPSSTGIAGVIHVRAMWYVLASGFQWITPRAWEWFGQFHLNNPVPIQGPPTTWAQFAQGAAPNTGGTANAQSSSGGSFYIDPPPDIAYSLLLDCVCFPIALTSDTDVEALPYFWTDAVPFFAAYYALLSAQSQSRHSEADAYFKYYQTFIQRARSMANSSVLRGNYEQAASLLTINKLGLSQKAASGGGAE